MTCRAFAAFVILLITASTTFSQAPTGHAGQISAILPSAKLFPKKGKDRLAAKGDTLSWDDRVRTYPTGRVRINLDDGSILSLGSDSELRIVKHEASTQTTALQLRYGKIRCRVARLTRAGGAFELRTPTAVAGVIGTDFGADSGERGITRIICLEGSVRVRNADPHYPGEVVCRPGQIVLVRVDGAPQVTQGTADQLENWRHLAEPDEQQ